MKRNNIKPVSLIIGFLVILIAGSIKLEAQTTAFTYQGKLSDNAVPANAVYDLEFKLFNAGAGGNQIGTTFLVPNVQITNGIFSVQLDFGANFDGTDRYLEIGIKPAGSPNPFTTLAPRQPVTSAPYSIQAITATNATNAQTAADSLRLGGTSASGYVMTNDGRLTDPRQPLPGSNDYIQNTQVEQSNTNFNVSGNGTVGGTLTGNSINATQGYFFDGDRFLFQDNNSNLFAGLSAGTANISGSNNSFFGIAAGFHNTDGSLNSFFGNAAGVNNLSGNGNSYFGVQTGFSNTIAGKNSFFGSQAGKNNTAGSNSFFGYQSGLTNGNGSANSFFGQETGKNNTSGGSNVFIGATTGNTNTTGSNNTLVGKSADVGSGNLTFATAIGSGALVGSNNTVVLGRNADAVQVPGTLTVQGNMFASGTFLTGLNAGNITAGVLSMPYGGTGITSSGPVGNLLRSNGSNWSSSPLQVNDVPDLGSRYIQNSVNQQSASNFNISGDGVIGGNASVAGSISGNVVNSATQYNIGGVSAFRATSPSSTTIAGIDSGSAITVGVENTFVGRFSGNNTTTGSYNTFVGVGAGNANIAGERNSYFGDGAGQANTSSYNSFFGNSAGKQNVNGSGNSFFGSQAGMNSVDGGGNSFFGANSGLSNMSNDNSFFGANSGAGNTTGFNNSFVGANSGESNTTGSRNIFFGYRAGSFNTTGQNNIYIGWLSGLLASTESNNTLLGYNTNILPGVTNSTAIGANSVAMNSHEIVLGTNSETVRLPGLQGGGISTLCYNNENVITFCSSSLRYKTNFAPYVRSLDVIKRLNPISFDWKSGGGRDVGFGAEDVARIDPLLVTFNAAGQVEGVKYDRLSTVFVNAIKEQQAQIEAQKAEIADQKAQAAQQTELLKNQQKRLDDQQQQLDALTKLVCAANPQTDLCKEKK